MLRVGFIYLLFLKTNLWNLYTKFHKANKTSEQKRSNEIWSGCEGPLGIRRGTVWLPQLASYP